MLKSYVKAAYTEEINTLKNSASEESFKEAKTKLIEGNLRKLMNSDETGSLYLIRSLSGELFIITEKSETENIESYLENKMKFSLNVTPGEVLGIQLSFAEFAAEPVQPLIDKLFYITIILVLFLIGIGMGMTLTTQDFKRILRSPKAMAIGPACQFGILPFIAYLLCTATNLHVTYPFVFIGVILVSASPGGIMSNLMTFYGKGDLALSISLTAVSTVASLFMTPLLLTLYVSGIPNVELPIDKISVQIAVLVVTPLGIGMFIRSKAENFAERSKTFFSILGFFAFVLLIVVGVLNNLEKFADTERYGITFYGIVFTITITAMFISIFIAKLLKLPNAQSRAIGLETGIQNGALAMTLALLLQDQVGDFYSSMFAASGLFSLWMYV